MQSEQPRGNPRSARPRISDTDLIPVLRRQDLDDHLRDPAVQKRMERVRRLADEQRA